MKKPRDWIGRDVESSFSCHNRNALRAEIQLCSSLASLLISLFGPFCSYLFSDCSFNFTGTSASSAPKSEFLSLLILFIFPLMLDLNHDH